MREAFPHGELESLHPREGIEKMKLPHADLIRSRPWNQMEGDVLGSSVWRRTWEGRARAQAELGVVRMREWLGERGE